MFNGFEVRYCLSNNIERYACRVGHGGRCHDIFIIVKARERKLLGLRNQVIPSVARQNDFSVFIVNTVFDPAQR